MRTIDPQLAERLCVMPRSEYLLLMSEVLQHDLTELTDEDLDAQRSQLEWGLYLELIARAAAKHFLEGQPQEHPPRGIMPTS